MSPAYHVVFSRCEAHHNGADDREGNGWNITQPTSTDIRLTSCHSQHNKGNVVDTFSCEGTVIEFCSIHVSIMGPQVVGKAAGVRCDLDTMNSAIRYNHIHDNESGGVVLEQGATGVVVQGNLVHHNRSGEDHGNGSGAGNVLSRNVTVKNEDSDIFVNSSFALSVDGLDVTATNLTIVAQ